MSPIYFLLASDSEPTSLGVIAALIAMVMAVVKIFEHVIQYFIAELKRRREEEDAKKPLDKRKKKRDSDGSIPESLLLRIEAAVEELHKWHMPEDPQQPGVKVWWNSEDQKQQLREALTKLNAILAELAGIRGTHSACNESQVSYIEKQRAEVEELRRRVDELQEQRLADRDALYERLIRVQNVFATRIERGVESGSGSGSGSGSVVVDSDPDLIDYEDLSDEDL